MENRPHGWRGWGGEGLIGREALRWKRRRPTDRGLILHYVLLHYTARESYTFQLFRISDLSDIKVGGKGRFLIFLSPCGCSGCVLK